MTSETIQPEIYNSAGKNGRDQIKTRNRLLWGKCVFLIKVRSYREDSRKKNTYINKSNRVRTTDAFSGELPAYLSLNSL